MHWFELDDSALVLPFKLVNLLGKKAGLGTGRERGLVSTPDEEVVSAVQEEHLAQVQGLCHRLNLVPEPDTQGVP